MVESKGQLRKIIKITHRILNQIKLKMHPDKMFIGCINKGFDFLGIHFGKKPEISQTSLENLRSKISQPYAKRASIVCFGHYIERWPSWCKAMLCSCSGYTENDYTTGQELCAHLLET